MSTQPSELNQPQVADIFRYESIDAREFARRLNVPESWVRDQVRTRCDDPIPHARFGKYVRFLWGSPALAAWLERHQQAHRPPQSDLHPVAEKPQIRPRVALQ